MTEKLRDIFPQLPWHRLWKLACLSKIKIFIWQIIEDHLPTVANLNKNHIVPSPLCSLCGEFDTTLHWFIECKSFQAVRSKTHWWIGTLSKFITHQMRDLPLITKNFFTFWNLWLARNEAIFRNKTINTSHIIRYIEDQTIFFLSAREFNDI